VLKHLKSTPEWEEKSLGAKGFTLIELLVVIVILGILAAVVIFAVSGVTDRGQASACKAEAATVRTAVEAYDAQWSAYPPTGFAELVPGFLQTTPVLVTYGGGQIPAATGLPWAGKCAGRSDLPANG